jgi:DNA-binding response OmpR family regulator
MKPTIFVVEDQEELRESICEELDRSGFNTVGASQGEKALALLHRSPRPALLLLDLLLPHKDGWEVVASMKADAKLRSVPIVVMSAVPPQATSLQAQGVAATLPKPFTMEELLFVVTRFVKPEKARRP